MKRRPDVSVRIPSHTHMNTYVQTLSLTHTHRRNKEGGAAVGRAVMEMSALPRLEDGFVCELGSEAPPWTWSR